MKTIHAKDVIEALFVARNASPAKKAHASRKLNAYLNQKSKDAKKQTQIAAAIKAHVTRRVQNLIWHEWTKP